MYNIYIMHNTQYEFKQRLKKNIYTIIQYVCEYIYIYINRELIGFVMLNANINKIHAIFYYFVYKY